jgi:uncharacterized membrane protein
MISWILAGGRMLGFGTSSGIRASLTLAMIGLVSRLDWGENHVHVTSRFLWMESKAAIIIFVLLAISESTFDKVQSLDRLQDRLILPYRLAAGAVAGACTVGHGWYGLIIGLAVGAVGAWFGQWVKHGVRPKSTPSTLVIALLSLMEDVGAFVATALTWVFAPVGYAVFGATLWLFARVSRRRKIKYKGLRVLR